MDKNGKVITTMIDVYREVTGDMTEPMVIGGGTYARAMPGIVAYGMLQPHREGTEHQKDEYVFLEDLYQAKEIYRIAIERLANLEM
jgi:succinyl-diaminopimelate desuccinylase